MSSERGNVKRSRAQKYCNSTVFKNTKYDTSQRTQNILSISQDGLCQRCKEKIEWKIKYKKYKPLTQPATCTHCHQKKVKKAYYTACQPCAKSLGVCAKCAAKKDIVKEFLPDERTQKAEETKMEQEIKLLRERDRRTLLRLQATGKLLDSLNPEKEDAGADAMGCEESATHGAECGDLTDEGDSEGEKDAYSLFE
ncbi:hypothetical protein ACOMHN_016739 [Nucella lapillus]